MINQPIKYRRAKTPTIIQMEAVECGVASLCIILGYYGRYRPLEQMRVECGVSRDGSNAMNLIKVARTYGLEAEGFKKSADDLFDIPYPAILFWEFNHFLVLEGFSKEKVFINDPASGPRAISYDDFAKSYAGAVLTFSKTDAFQKGGKPESFINILWTRIKDSSKALSFLQITALTLLLPGFAFPAFLLFFISTFYSKNIAPWKENFVVIVLFCAGFTGALSWLQNHILNRLNTKLSVWFSTEFLWRLLRLPMSFYTQRYAGEISYRMSLNNSVAQALTGSLSSTVVDMMLVFLYAIIMFFYDAAIASIAVSVAVINFLTMLLIFKSRANAYACVQQTISRSMTESIGGLQYIETIKSKGGESDFFSKWSGFYTKNVNARQEIGKKDVILTTAPVLFQMLAVAALLGIGSLRIIEGQISIATLMAMQLLLVNFLKPINRFVGLGQLIQNTKIDIERLNDVLKNAEDPIYQLRKNIVKKDLPSKLSGHLEFRNVSFRYAPLSPLIIDNLSFTIHPGQRLALVGPSGCGKSTIAKLASGLFRPESGQILYDGMPIEEIPAELFSHSVATVDQEFFLFNGTFRENITLWNNKVPQEVLFQAVSDACIHDEIIKRSDGFEAMILEGGANLSGGQRQRIEIARAMLYSPSMMILDEATSALDSFTEKYISDRIRERGCSAVMIAHRLSTIQDCDEIIVLDKGLTVQRGSHDKLKALDGVYRNLVMQETYNES
jgi:NHLM bacteriocin system ABC transporter peptidase/ATP-binding protein